MGPKRTNILIVKGCRQCVRLVFNLNAHFSQPPSLFLLGSQTALHAGGWLPKRKCLSSEKSQNILNLKKLKTAHSHFMTCRKWQLHCCWSGGLLSVGEHGVLSSGRGAVGRRGGYNLNRMQEQHPENSCVADSATSFFPSRFAPLIEILDKWKMQLGQNSHRISFYFLKKKSSVNNALKPSRTLHTESWESALFFLNEKCQLTSYFPSILLPSNNVMQ